MPDDFQNKISTHDDYRRLRRRGTEGEASPPHSGFRRPEPPRPELVDMEMDDEDKLDAPEIMPARPDFPYGLRICLTHSELRKLDLDADCQVGDVIDMRAFAEVTSISKDGDSCRIELQIQKLAVENEMDEGEDE